MVLGLVFHVCCTMLCVAPRCKNHCFVLVFRVFRAHRPCHKNLKKDKSVVVLVYVFREGSWLHFVIDCCSMFDIFWEVFGLTNRKKQVSERADKTALKKV